MGDRKTIELTLDTEFNTLLGLAERAATNHTRSHLELATYQEGRTKGAVFAFWMMDLITTAEYELFREIAASWSDVVADYHHKSIMEELS